MKSYEPNNAKEDGEITVHADVLGLAPLGLFASPVNAVFEFDRDDEG
jgi:hypothetical protein